MISGTRSHLTLLANPNIKDLIPVANPTSSNLIPASTRLKNDREVLRGTILLHS